MSTRLLAAFVALAFAVLFAGAVAASCGGAQEVQVHHRKTAVVEDDPGWDCATQGNKTCGGEGR